MVRPVESVTVTVYEAVLTLTVGVPTTLTLTELYRRAIESAPVILLTVNVEVNDNPAGKVGLTLTLSPITVPVVI